MIGADLTQRILTAGQYDIAKPAVIEKRTAFLRPLQNKMRRVSRKIDVGSHAITDLTGKRAVALGGLIINVNFPTDTAAVAALIGNAGKCGIIGRSDKLHTVSFPARIFL